MSGKVIDMTVPGHIATAHRLAYASTPSPKWGKAKAAEVFALAGPEDLLWGVFRAEDDAACAITGNGPTSEANAQFFVVARAIVLGLVEEVDRLKTQLRNANGGHEWTRHARNGWTVCGSCGLVRNYESGGKTCTGRLPNIAARDAECAPAYTTSEQTGGGK